MASNESTKLKLFLKQFEAFKTKQVLEKNVRRAFVEESRVKDVVPAHKSWQGPRPEPPNECFIESQDGKSPQTFIQSVELKVLTYISLLNVLSWAGLRILFRERCFRKFASRR